MTIKTELYSRLSGYAGLTGLVSTRIHPVRLPQNCTMPAVTYQIVSGPRVSNFGDDTGDVRYRVQVDCWASAVTGESASADAVADQVKAALQRYRGGNIQDIYLENEIDGDAYESDADLYRVTLEFIVWFKE